MFDNNSFSSYTSGIPQELEFIPYYDDSGAVNNQSTLIITDSITAIKPVTAIGNFANNIIITSNFIAKSIYQGKSNNILKITTSDMVCAIFKGSLADILKITSSPSARLLFSSTNNPGTVIDNNDGNLVWQNPSNAQTNDGNYAFATAAILSTTNYLKATNFGFNLPSNAIVYGISVEIERKASLGIGTTDLEVKLVKNGTILTTNKATGTNWSTNDTEIVYGGASDLWGDAFTYNDINSANFGVVLSASISAGLTASVDYFSITVYYTSGGEVYSSQLNSLVKILTTANIRTLMSGGNSSILKITTSSTAKQISQGNLSSSLKITDLMTPRAIMSGKEGVILRISDSIMGNYIVIGKENSILRIVDSLTGQSLLVGKSNPTLKIITSPTTRKLVIGNFNPILKISDSLIFRAIFLGKESSILKISDIINAVIAQSGIFINVADILKIQSSINTQVIYNSKFNDILKIQNQNTVVKNLFGNINSNLKISDNLQGYMILTGKTNNFLIIYNVINADLGLLSIKQIINIGDLIINPFLLNTSTIMINLNEDINVDTDEIFDIIIM